MITVSRSSSLEFTSDQSLVISLRALFLEQREMHVSCDAHKQHMIIVETTTSSLCVLSGKECLQYHHIKYSFNHTCNCWHIHYTGHTAEPAGTTTFNNDNAIKQAQHTQRYGTGIVAATTYFTVKFNSTLLALQNQGSVVCCSLGWI
jgi:hypothetical protein